jgi:tRNA dimethylallyltransferase
MIIILGPTAVGKTKVSIEIAKRLGGEIISADSMQVYRGMDIGTAKPTLKEQQGIPHHLIDIKDPDEAFSVSDFVKQVKELSREITQRDKVPIIVGGTGLYLWALLKGYAFPLAAADKNVRQRLEKETPSALYSRLSRIDPQAAQKIHPNDKKRIIRALEVYELTGQPISMLQTKNKAIAKHQKPILIGLTLPRETLYQRIEERVDQMVEKGLIEEVKGLLAKGFSKELPSFQALGYKEVAEYLDAERSKEEMINELKKRTRNFARRQMAWFKRFKDVKWFTPVGRGPEQLTVDTQSILDYINSI